MARHGSTRSPSPTGSSHSAKRPRRDDNYRYTSQRDDARAQHYRRRSRSPEIRYRDRHYTHQRDRSRPRHKERYDDRFDDHGRSSRRDRSRERRVSRDRDTRETVRHRSRDRDDRAQRGDVRERDRAQRDQSAGRVHKPEKQGPESSESIVTPTRGPREEDKKAERLAKLQAWKQRQATEKKRKEQEENAETSVQSPSTTTNQKVDIPLEGSSSKVTDTKEVASKSPAPLPYAGKFDPKAIAKKSTHLTTGMNKLGVDVLVPQLPRSTNNGSIRPVNLPDDTKSFKSQGKVSRFGLASRSAPEEKVTKRHGLNLAEEESGIRKLERLPTLVVGENDADVAMSDGVEGQRHDDDDDDDDGLLTADNEEEAAKAARLASEKREERLQHVSTEAKENGDTVIAENAESDHAVAEPIVPSVPVTSVVSELQDDVDPLDAFMSGLTEKPTFVRRNVKSSRGSGGPPEALFGDEEVVQQSVAAEDDLLNIAAKKKKKEIPTVNHEKIKYEPFRRQFYHEPAELAELSEEQVTDLRLELDGIKIRGLNAPKPVQKWSQCGLGVQTLDVIQKLGYERPSSIQAQAIPSIMSGRDVIGVAKTGSGKTIAFLLPMFRHIKDQRPLDMLEGPIGLVMTPTRELATQIHRECRPFLKALGLRAVCAYGGPPIKDQISELKRGAEIVVCTPGRMIDLLAANSGRVINLKRVTYIVLDEADRMFDMGFEPQVMKIMTNIRPDRQTVLFSATFPRQMETLARKALSKPVEIVVGGRSVVAPEITQIVEVREDESKFIRLLELLGNLYDDAENEDDRALVFVDRHESADGLLRDLMRKGYPCQSIHGGKDQIDRDSTIADFKAGVIPILIATSVAARGLDVKQLKLVVNFDAPNHLEDYVHRAGRTGRAGNTGTAVTFLTPDQGRYAVDIAKALKQSGQEVPEEVQALAQTFLEQVKAGKEKASGSGFGGKGLERLEQERETARNRERKAYKTGDEADDDDKDEKTKSKDNDLSDGLITKAASVVQASTAVTSPAQVPGVPKGIDLDGKIVVHRSEPAASSGAKGGKNALDKVGQAVASIHDRLSKNRELRQGMPIDNKGPDAGAFHATLEINDFPQKARWAVTNRTNVAKILEATGTSITTKGNFYAAGKEPQTGETPKLYILVEGDTELVVTTAMRDLMRLLKDGAIAAAEGDARVPAAGGRYSVV